MDLEFPDSDGSSYSSQPLLEDPLERASPIISRLFATRIEHNTLNIFALLIDQGSFNVVRYGNRIIIVDI